MDFFDKNIEGLSSRLAKGKGFLPQKHRLEIFGRRPRVQLTMKNQKKNNPILNLSQNSLGRNNIFKTIKIIKEDGSGTEIDFGYRIKQFKCKNGCEHHNHLVCVVCGQQTYLDNVTLEDLQDKLAKENHFTPKKHAFQIYGLCKNCRSY